MLRTIAPKGAALRYDTVMSILARALSLLGHPLVTLAFAMLVLARAHGEGDVALGRIALGCASSAAIVVAYSWWRVRRGDWAHVDASQVAERKSFNRFLLVGLLVASVVTARGNGQVAVQLGLAAAIVGVAMATARFCKLSIHVAFDVYAAALATQASWLVGGVLFVLALAVLWSRLHLRRHLPRDVIAGFFTGGVAGAAACWLALAP